jgi:myo-inositol-1(or 4)-monophosphatase
MSDGLATHIRKASVEDTPAVTRLLCELEHPSSEPFVQHEISCAFTEEKTILLVADQGEGPVGFLSLGIASPYYESGPFGRIRALCVSASHRREGIGAALVAEAERLARQQGCVHIEVSSHVRRQGAHDFYRQQGYVDDHRLFVKPLPKATDHRSQDLELELHDLVVTATEAATAAGAIQKANFGHHQGITSQYAHDLKLETDQQCERAIIERIRANYPDHSITAEESGISEGTGDYNWIIDPLDGTVNFYHGIAHFCTSVACYRRQEQDVVNTGHLTDLGEPVVGVVYDAIGQNRYIGIRGHGATHNGITLRAPAPVALEKAAVTMALGSHEETMQEMMHIQSTLLRKARKIRVLGASALDICLVAQGVTAGHLQARIHAWDFAAAGIILEELGGSIHIREFEPGLWRLVACNAGTEDPLCEIMTL